MQYSFLSAAVLALVSSVVAQTAGFDAITAPTQDQNIPAGSSFDIVWQPGTVTGDITITLLQGATPNTLVTGAVVAKSISNSLGKYTWSVPSSSSFATYGFEITLDSAPTTLQYSFPFHITGGTSSSASGSASTSASGTASTKTVQVSTGPSYTGSSTVATSTSTIPSSTSTVVSTSSNSSLISSLTHAPTSSNFTLSTTLTKVSSTSIKTSATATGSSTTSASPVSTNAAATHIAGSIAMVGGLVLALAL